MRVQTSTNIHTSISWVCLRVFCGARGAAELLRSASSNSAQAVTSAKFQTRLSITSCLRDSAGAGGRDRIMDDDELDDEALAQIDAAVNLQLLQRPAARSSGQVRRRIPQSPWLLQLGSMGRRGRTLGQQPPCVRFAAPQGCSQQQPAPWQSPPQPGGRGPPLQALPANGWPGAQGAGQPALQSQRHAGGPPGGHPGPGPAGGPMPVGAGYGAPNHGAPPWQACPRGHAACPRWGPATAPPTPDPGNSPILGEEGG